MGLYASEKDGDRLIGREDGLQGALACIHKGKDTMEVWCEEGELFYGHLPADTPVATIAAAVKFYKAGEKAGEQYGEHTAQRRMRYALGL